MMWKILVFAITCILSLLVLLYFMTGTAVRNVSSGELPFQVTVHLKTRDESLSGHWCGGTIIGRNLVLTAAKCVNGLFPAQLVIIAGVLNSSRKSLEDTKVVRRVTEVFVHEEYHQKSLTNDIAIVQVSPRFPTDNPAVKAIPLRPEAVPGGLKCEVSGWTREPILQVAPVQLMTYEECRDMYRNHPEGSIEPGMLCARNFQGKSGECYSERGGSLVCGGLLTGVVTHDEGCILPDYPRVVFTDVAYYKEWIERKMHKAKDEL